jgi:glutamate formiminotransferase
MLLAVPNFSEGTDMPTIKAISDAAAERAHLLDVHSDRIHNRTVLTLAGEPEQLEKSLFWAAATAVTQIDLAHHRGVHPHIGVIDVCPIVYRSPDEREDAIGVAERVAKRFAADISLPVFFYGEMASSEERAERAFFRTGGPVELARRVGEGTLKPDLGPEHVDPSSGGVLITARPPLGAFNVELDTADVEVARDVAAALRESGGGLAGVRAIGLPLPGERSQVSTNIHDPVAVPLGEVVERIRALAEPRGAKPVEAELIGLIPIAALKGYPVDVPIRAFKADDKVIERRLKALAG